MNSWEDLQGEASSRSRESGRLGWWAAVAMFLSLLLHVVVFFALDRIQIALGIQEPRVLETQNVVVREAESMPMDYENLPPPAEEAPAVPPDTAKLLEDVDILQALPKDEELEMRPDIKEEEYAIQMANPAASGELEATAIDISAGLDFDVRMPEPGRMEDTLPPLEIGRITVDPGSDLVDDRSLGAYTEDLIKRGANGEVDRGALDGVVSLDDLLGLPANELMGKKTMLPSDLLFEFNSATLRESAKVGLMKLVLLMDLNPGLYCWIEGHTDLVGGDEFNFELSRKRAEAVKVYLVKAAGMDGERIKTRGLGKTQPLVTAGDVDAQAPNRRVEIRMRKTPPPAEAPVRVAPRAKVVPEPPAVDGPEAAENPPVRQEPVLVKPKRALPAVEEEVVPPKAQPVVEEPEPPKARPVVEEPEPPKALPVEEE